jgi:ArsR family transcriptional regulator
MNLDQLANQYKALGHPARLRILNLLTENQSLCVCEIMRVLDYGQSFVSRHLAILRDAELVTTEKHGTWVHYRLTPRAVELLKAGELQNVSQLSNDLVQLNTAQCEPC